MTPSRETSRARTFSTRNLARILLAGAVTTGATFAVSGTANAAPDEVWDRIAKCESGGKWNTNTGNGYAGGLQFSPSTWRAHGGKGNPANASREEQIRVAERVLASQGWGAWPVCSKKVGAKGKPTPRSEKSSTAKTVAGKTTRTEVKKNSAAAPKQGGNYTVAAGDTLSTIASKHNVPGGWQALFNNNRDVLGDPNKLKVGQQLKLG